jgi:hypothetical protein
VTVLGGVIHRGADSQRASDRMVNIGVGEKKERKKWERGHAMRGRGIGELARCSWLYTREHWVCRFKRDFLGYILLLSLSVGLDIAFIREQPKQRDRRHWPKWIVGGGGYCLKVLPKLRITSQSLPVLASQAM